MKIRGGEPLRVYAKMSEIYETDGVWKINQQWKTFGGIFSEINLDSSIKDGILLTIYL
jgi:lipopolysaccharide assembly outer membrane protein LptD (OstA)